MGGFLINFIAHRKEIHLCCIKCKFRWYTGKENLFYILIFVVVIFLFESQLLSKLTVHHITWKHNLAYARIERKSGIYVCTFCMRMRVCHPWRPFMNVRPRDWPSCAQYNGVIGCCHRLGRLTYKLYHISRMHAFYWIAIIGA